MLDYLFKALVSTSLFLLYMPARADDVLSLPALLQKVRAQNTDLEAARRAANVKTEEARAAGIWENPKFSYADEDFPSGAAGAPNEKIRHYRIEQNIAFPGKLSLDARMKRHEALIAAADYRAKELEELGEARMRYYQLYLTDRQILLSEESVEILKNALANTQGRLSANQTTASDAFMVQTELAKRQNDLFIQQQQRVLAEIALNSLLNQAPETSWGKAEAPVLKDVPVTLADLQQLTRQNSPLYLNALHEVDHANAMNAHNKLEWAPDFGVLYEREQSPNAPDGRILGVSVSFPLWVERPWALTRAGAEHAQEAQATAQSMQTMARTMVAMEFTETQTHRTVAQHYLDAILPSAQSSLRIAQQQYASGQTDFLHLLEAFRAWIDAHDEYEAQLYHFGEHWSALERWTGVELDRAKEELKTPPTPMEGMSHGK
jgi:cobalt-zinc-cadmium efflux system outer membrane protein